MKFSDILRTALHALRGKPQHVEGADQVDADRALEQRQIVGAVAAHDARGGRDAGAVDRQPQRTEASGGFKRYFLVG